MRRLIWNWVISSLALWLAILALGKGVTIAHPYDVLWLAPLLGLINVIVGVIADFLAGIACLVNLLTLGLFGFLLSFIGYVLAVLYLGNLPGFTLHVQSFAWAAALAVFMALFSTLLNMILPGKKARRE